MLDQSSGVYSLNEFFGSAQRSCRRATQSGAEPCLLASPQAPQYKVDVDREQMASVGVDFGTAMSAFSVNFGGTYVNDTFQEGKVRRVYVQADEVSRATPQRLSAIYVPNAKGEQVPLSEFFTVKQTAGPSVIPHFNLYRSIKIEGNQGGQQLRSGDRGDEGDLQHR